MHIFRYFLKVFRKGSFWIVLMYTVIFSGISAFFSTMTTNPTEQAFELEQSNVAVIDRDHSALSESMTEFLYSKATKVDIQDDETAIKDALFFRTADLILILPEGMAQQLQAGQTPELISYQIPDGTYGMMAKQLAESYLRTARAYFAATGDFQTEKITEDFADPVTVQTTGQAAENHQTRAQVLFNFFVYSVMAVMLFALPAVLISFHRTDMRRRNAAAPMGVTRRNLMILTAMLVISLGIFMAFSLTAFLLNGSYLLSIRGALYLLNLLVLVIVTLTISFLVSVSTKKGAAVSIAQIISLGCAFLSGSFVPQYMLGDTMKTIGAFTPAFWTVKANDEISKLNTFTTDTLGTYFQCIGIQLLFAIAFVSIMLLLGKRRRTEA